MIMIADFASYFFTTRKKESGAVDSHAAVCELVS